MNVSSLAKAVLCTSLLTPAAATHRAIGAWDYTCTDTSCVVKQEMRDGVGKDALWVIVIFSRQADGVRMLIATPEGRENWVLTQLDTGPQLMITNGTCQRERCVFAETLSPERLRELQASSKIGVYTPFTTSDPVGFDLDMTGLAEAIDALPALP